jgi:hypothetical protein
MAQLQRAALLAAALLIACLNMAQAEPLPDHQPWDEAVFAHIRDTYGQAADSRMRKLESIIAKNYHAPVEQKLDVTNYALNHLPWIADRRILASGLKQLPFPIPSGLQKYPSNKCSHAFHCPQSSNTADCIGHQPPTALWPTHRHPFECGYQ